MATAIATSETLQKINLWRFLRSIQNEYRSRGQDKQGAPLSILIGPSLALRVRINRSRL